MHEMEKSMCEEIARRTPFSATELFDEWQSCKSFDYLLSLIEVARVYGFATVRGARSFLAKHDLDITDIYNPPTQSEAHKGRWQTLSGLTKRAPDGVICPACKSENAFMAVICVNCGAHTAPRR